MILKSKYIFISILTLALILILSYLNPLAHLIARDDAEGRIAYVDVQTVFNVHPEKEEAESDLNSEAQQMQQELENKAKDLSKEEQQELLKEYQARLSQKEQELIQTLLLKIDKSIKEVAEEKKVKLVLDKKNVIYGGYDMTQDVINYISSNLNSEEIQE
jgi:outer membrane protein